MTPTETADWKCWAMLPHRTRHVSGRDQALCACVCALPKGHPGPHLCGVSIEVRALIEAPWLRPTNDKP